VLHLAGNDSAILSNAIDVRTFVSEQGSGGAPVIGYAAFCGAQIQIFLKTSPIELGFFSSIIGTQFGFVLGQSGSRSLIGINVFAAGFAAFLFAQNRYEKSRPAFTSGRPVGQLKTVCDERLLWVGCCRTLEGSYRQRADVDVSATIGLA